MKDFPLTIYFVDDNGNLREKKCVRDGGFNACGEKPNCTQNECAEIRLWIRHLASCCSV